MYILKPPYTGELEVTSITAGLPAGLLWRDGTLHVCDTERDVVDFYRGDGSRTGTLTVSQPWNIRSATAGGHWIVSHANQASWYREGRSHATIRGLLAPFDIAPTGNGEVWISEQGLRPGAPGRLIRWSTEGRPIQGVSYPWKNPEGPWLDPQGILWVAETERGEIVRVDPAGHATLAAHGLGLPVVIAGLPDDDMLVATSGADPRLVRLERSRE